MSQIPPSPDRNSPPPIPQSVGYSPPGMQRPGGSKPSSLVTGLIIGVILSAIIWFAGFALVDNLDVIGWVALAAVGLKYLGAIILVCFREWRFFALGLFLSLPIGAVIFFGACAANL